MTDNKGLYEIVLRYGGEKQLRVDYSESYNRRRHEDDEIEQGIETKWVSRKEKNGSLFNGKKFRFGGMEVDGEECVIRLGITDYKSYIGTHFGDDVGRYGEEWMAMPLGNVVIPETSDRKSVLLIRSSYTSEGEGGVVFPGGHPEPDMVKNLHNGDNARVLKELWDGARREVMEELWIGDDEVGVMGEMIFLGLVKRCVDGKVSMIFSTRMSMSGKEVLERFRERNDGVESDGVMVEDLSNMHELTAQATTSGLQLLPETRGAARLWLHKYLQR